MPRSRHLAIFVLTTDNRHCFIPATHARTRVITSYLEHKHPIRCLGDDSETISIDIIIILLWLLGIWAIPYVVPITQPTTYN